MQEEQRVIELQLKAQAEHDREAAQRKAQRHAANQVVHDGSATIDAPPSTSSVCLQKKKSPKINSSHISSGLQPLICSRRLVVADPIAPDFSPAATVLVCLLDTAMWPPVQ